MPNPTAFGHENDDALLIAAVVRGDINAFRKLIIQYEKLVVSIVFKMVKQKEDSEDICQDVFLKIYEKLPGFRYQSKLSTWIGSIAFNTCVNFVKKRKPFLLEDLKNSGNDDEEFYMEMEVAIKDLSIAPDEQLVNKEMESLLLRSIESLPIIQKTVLHLFHHDDFSLQEISEVTSLPVTTIKSHLFRARKQLKEEMNKYLNI